MSVFFTSDLHFGHKNLIEGLRKMSVEESDNLIISNWNKIVHKKDIVYVLGDITMESPKLIGQYLSQLKGEIRIVGGNHDTIKCCKVFQELKIPVMGVLDYKGFICTHVPIHPSQIEHTRGNIHGHIHISGEIEGLGRYNPPELKERYYNVNIEFHDYKPVLFETIKQYFENYEIH